jgi:hypothetical protein
MEVYIPVTHGNWPEDGEEIHDVYLDKEAAREAGEEHAENGSRGRSQFFVAERELHENDE